MSKEKIILGIDETGRGAWAGPLVVGAVILDSEFPDGLADSKLLSRLQREKLYNEIKSHALAAATGWANHNEIDELGLTKASSLAISRALADIDQPHEEIIIDGKVNFLEGNPLVRCLPKADQSIPAVSAASIIAKVERDNYMLQQADIHKMYGFEMHVGYGTRAHIAAIEKHGICPIHRVSYKSLARFA